MTRPLIIFAPIRLIPGARTSAPTALRCKWSSAGHDDTHNRHQQAWTFLYPGGRQKRSVPGHGRRWTLWPCFASRGPGVRVPLAPQVRDIIRNREPRYGDGCEVDPGRPAGISTGGFPRVASRTRRASRPGTGLSASPVRGCRGDSSAGWPWCRDGCPPVAIARGAHRGGVEQCDLGGGRPPSAVAVAPADGLPCDPAVFAPRPPYDPVPDVAGQVSEGGGAATRRRWRAGRRALRRGCPPGTGPPKGARPRRCPLGTGMVPCRWRTRPPNQRP
jgi:hypothetical protein